MRVADGVIHKTVGDEVVLLDYERGIYYGLDPVGARVWQLLAGGSEVDAIVEVLTEEYEVDRDTAQSDVVRLIAELEEKGLLRR